MSLVVTGAAYFPAVLSAADVSRLTLLFPAEPVAGQRLGEAVLTSIADLIAASGPVGSIATGLLGAHARPRRALLLDKSSKVNWRLGWHQDRTISVRERIDVPGFTSWSVKSGQLHVQPPFEVTERMITLRIHLDKVDEANAPLRVLAGSHSLGRLDNDQVDAAASELPQILCLADAGDVWAYNTAVVHASSEQQYSGRRRVLQIDYSAERLPGGLEWAVGDDPLFT